MSITSSSPLFSHVDHGKTTLISWTGFSVDHTHLTSSSPLFSHVDGFVCLLVISVQVRLSQRLQNGKGWLEEKGHGTHSTGTVIAVKKLNSESFQGFEEWQCEVNFLGRVSHPNLVKLLGYCLEGDELLLVL
ncbi:Protein kinase domain protein [Raphanus sativus]|nr:Protein kinase domain protein [Raphanus sativus]